MAASREFPPGSTEALLQRAKAHEAAGEYAQSHSLLRLCQASCDLHTALPLVNTIQASLWRLDPRWAACVTHGSVSLRRCRRQDASFFQRCFTDPVFVRRFSRRTPWRGDLGQALENSGRQPPLRTGLLMWVIETRAGGPVGLASLSSLDPVNRRAEFSIGFPGEAPFALGGKVSLMALHFALVTMSLNKVYVYVYPDNETARQNALRLGFQTEGLLQEHFQVPGEGFISVHMLGLTSAQFHQIDRLKVLAKRLIGQAW
ncbi:MAG: GNAT family N-acetyltransferase [Aquabacterium sp.]|nr:GNAT family N-acetyltransferase [Aquabacterium sp.]